jgi:hypothetical protein
LPLLGSSKLYEYVGSGNKQPLAVAVTGGPGSTELICTGRKESVGAGSNNTNFNALSADGRTVFFRDGPCESGSGSNTGVSVPATTLYARIDGELPDAHTVPISQHSPRDCGPVCQSSPPGDALFLGASADGSKVFFTSTQQLTDSASEDSQPGDSAANEGHCMGTVGVSGCNLYLYDFAKLAGENLLDVSAGDLSGGGPRVQGVVAVSSDGSHIYFVAKGVLTGVPNDQSQSALDGGNNLYMFERDAAHPDGHVAFVATLPQQDQNEWGSEAPGLPANVTPDGRVLVFTSSGALTRDDARQDGAQQVFRYDAQSEELVRVSIGDGGFNDNGNAGTGNASIALANVFMFRPGSADPNPTMSDDGTRVFFQSPIGLTPRALNDVKFGIDSEGHPAYAENVYEYHDGHVYLISDGRDANSDELNGQCPPVSSVCLIGTDATGANVFFTTADQLVPADTDTQIDVYDARICTAADPCITPAPPSLPPCLGEACHGTPPAAPSLLSPGSASFNGQGNLTSTPAIVKPKSKPPTRAQKLAAALKLCRRDKQKSKRATCEKSAKKKYGAETKTKAKSRKGGK